MSRFVRSLLSRYLALCCCERLVAALPTGLLRAEQLPVEGAPNIKSLAGAVNDIYREGWETNTRTQDVWAEYTGDQCFGPVVNVSATGYWQEVGADGYWSEGNDGCDLKRGSRFFEDDVVASEVLNCWSARKKNWILFAGDSNTRNLLIDVVNRFKVLKQITSISIQSPEKGHGIHNHADWDAFITWRDARSQASTFTTQLSMRFIHNVSAVHWDNWQGEWNYNGTFRGTAIPKTLITSATKPSTIIFSAGLWILNPRYCSTNSELDCGCKASAAMYEQLWRNSGCSQNQCLFVTTANIGWHETITSSDIAKSRDCVIRSRTSKSVPWPPPRIFDLFELTKSMPTKDWVSYSGGDHYSYGSEIEPKLSPVGRAVVGAWLHFVCSA